jgi:O-antigen/teichoic acid export membrane protein
MFSVFCGRGLMAVRQLLLVPVLISAWGVNYYGHWLVLSAIPTFLAMSNMGFGTSAVLSIGLDVAAGRVAEAWNTLTTALWIILGIAVTVLAIAFAWMHFSAGAQTVSDGIASPALVVTLLLATLFVRMLAQPLMGWWTGIGKPATPYHYSNLAAVGELILCIAVPVSGGNALVLASFLLQWNVIWLALFGFATYQLLDPLPAHRRSPQINLSTARQLLTTGLGHQLGPLWQAVLFQGSLFLANALLGPAGAVLWASLRIVTRYGNQLLELIGQSLSPEFQLAYAEGNTNRLRQLHAVGLVGSSILSTAVSLGLIAVGPSLFRIWTRHAFVVPLGAWWIMSLSIIPCALWWISGEYQRSINQPWRLNMCALFASLVSVACMGAGGKYGIIAFAFGSLLFDVSMVALVLPITLKLLDDTILAALARGLHLMLARVPSLALFRKRSPPHYTSSPL